jgi:hypothetical protein
MVKGRICIGKGKQLFALFSNWKSVVEMWPSRWTETKRAIGGVKMSSSACHLLQLLFVLWW